MRHMLILTALAIGWPLTVAAQSPASKPAAIPPDVERVLKYVPDNAHLVVVVPSLDQLVAGVSAFGKAIGVQDMADISASDILEGPFGGNIKDINTTAPFVLTLSVEDLAPILIASPFADEHWKATTKPAEELEGARLIELGDEGYVAVGKDRVCIFAREKAELGRALRSTGKGTAQLREHFADPLSRRQAMLYVDVPPWREIIQRQLGVIAQGANMGIAAAGQQDEAPLQFLKWMFEQADKVVSETQTYVLAVRIDAAGVFIEDRATFKPEGSVATYLQKVRKPQRDPLRGLSAEGGAIMFACEWELPPGTESFNEAFVKVMLGTKTLPERVDRQKFEAALQKSVEAYRNITGFNGAFGAVPDGQSSTQSSVKGRGMLYSGLYLTRAADDLRRDVRAVWETCPQMMEAWGTYRSASVRHESEQIGDAAVDVYHFSLESDDVNIQPMLQAMYGSDSALYMGPHPEGVVYVLGPQEPARKLMTKLLSGDVPLLSRDARVVALFHTLTPNPQFCMLVDAPGALKLIEAVMQPLGLPLPPLPHAEPGMPLVGFGFYLESQAVRSELFVPSQPVKMVVETFAGVKKTKTD